MLKSLVVIRNVLVVLAVLLLNTISHTSVVTATSSHEMNGMNHSTSESGSCATLCRSTVVNRDIFTILHQDQEDDDDKPPKTLYSLSQRAYTSEKLIKQQQYADAVKPPPKVPVYIMYNVFRV